MLMPDEWTKENDKKYGVTWYDYIPFFFSALLVILLGIVLFILPWILCLTQ